MKNFILLLCIATIVVCLGISCAPKTESSQASEYVPGIKRWSGPYKRITGPSVEPAEALNTPDVTITVDAYTSGFKPDVIRVKKNQIVKLILKGTDDGDLPKITGLKEFSGHGFHVLGPYDIWITGLRGNVTREIVFKATYPGEFDFECPVFCGVEHYKMRGKLIIEES